jgi:hypothetical protein
LEKELHMSDINNDMSGGLLTPEQKREIQVLVAGGLTRSQARYRVLTPAQKRRFEHQISDSEARRWAENRRREMVNHLRKSVAHLRRQGGRRSHLECTITEYDLLDPDYCPVFPWIELHYPGEYHYDPAGATIDRIDNDKGYVPGNVVVVSWRANALRRDATDQELRALADYWLDGIDDFGDEDDFIQE